MLAWTLVAGLTPAAPAAAAPPPLKWDIKSTDDGLRPEGGTFRLTLHFTKGGGLLPAGALALVPSFADGWGRVFWEGAPASFVPGDAASPGKVELTIPYPPLPPGGYAVVGRVLDAAKKEIVTVRVPTGRFERSVLQRDLVWLFWGRGDSPDAMVRTLQDLGLNGSGGDALDFRFPYTWFKDHARQTPEARYPEDVVLRPEGTGLEWFRGWVAGMRSAGGLALVLLTDEIDTNYGVPAARDMRLRLARVDPWMKVPTLSRFNAFFQTDFLTWDEVLRDGFPPLAHPQYGANPIKWTADRQFRDVEMPMMRREFIRQANPFAVVGPGATHCLTDEWADSFNDRAKNWDPTLDFTRNFIGTQPHYGLRPINKLISLRPAFLSVENQFQPYWEGHEHLYWAALANNARLFLLYAPGDGYGSAPVAPDGTVTPEGKGFQAIRSIIHPLRPTILSTRSQLEPAVVYLEHGHANGGRNLMDGLIASGIMPLGAKAPGSEAKLIFGIDSGLEAPVLEAVRGGAGLVCQGNPAEQLAALGIEVSTNAPAPECQEIDLSPLAKAFPGLAGVKVLGTCGGDARAKAGSGLEEVRADGKLLAISGPLGKGWVLYLNVALQDFFKPTGWGGSWEASNLSILVDDSIPGRNAALVRALLARAGVPERVRVTDRNGKVAPLVRAFGAETQGGAQKYLFVVSEALGKLSQSPTDPKSQGIALACDNPLTGTIRVLDPAVKAIRDLRSGKMLPVRADAQGVETDYGFVPGQGTLLALLPEAPAGTMSVALSQPDVAGVEAVHVELCRRDASGATPALPGHALWVRFLDPQGREVEALTGWATGGGPHVFTARFALNDPEGEWTLVAEDQTDGTRAETKLRRQAKAGGLRVAFAAAGNLVRGAPGAGTLRLANEGSAPLSLSGLSAACRAPGVRVSLSAKAESLPAGGTLEIPLTLDIAPDARPGPVLVELRRGDSAIGGARVEVPEPFAVRFETTPYLDGDLIITEIRGILRTSAAGPTPVTIRLPAVADLPPVPEVTVNSPAAYTDVPFAIPLLLSRSQAQAMVGTRHEGIDLALEAPGLPPGIANYAPNILPLARAPQRVGSVSGGKLAVRINNFTGAKQRVAVTLAPLPGEEAKPWQADGFVAPRSTATLERAVAGLPHTIDPGLYDVALEWTAGDSVPRRAALFVEEALEQAWWVRFERPGESPTGGEIEPELPGSEAQREKEGWRRVVTQGVLWWKELAPPKAGPGRLYAATRIESPQARPVLVGCMGPGLPAALWINGTRLELASSKPARGARAPADPLTLCDRPVDLHQGANSVTLAFDPSSKTKSPGTSLVLQDPTTRKRDRTLKIGEGK